MPKVQNYVEACLLLLKNQKIKPISAEKLQIELLIYPPDKKRRDIDNVIKVLLDTIQRANIIENDYKIWLLIVRRKEIRKHGEVEFTIKELE